MKIIISMISLVMLSCKNSLNNLNMNYKGSEPNSKSALIIYQSLRPDFEIKISKINCYDKYELYNNQVKKRLSIITTKLKSRIFIIEGIFNYKNKKVRDLIIFNREQDNKYEYHIGKLNDINEKKIVFNTKEKPIEFEIKEITNKNCYIFINNNDLNMYVQESNNSIEKLVNKLKEKGFKVIESLNEKAFEIREKIGQFQTNEADTKLFYCSAHGNVNKNGTEFFGDIYGEKIAIPYEETVNCKKIYMFVDNAASLTRMQ